MPAGVGTLSVSPRRTRNLSTNASLTNAASPASGHGSGTPPSHATLPCSRVKRKSTPSTVAVPLGKLTSALCITFADATAGSATNRCHVAARSRFWLDAFSAPLLET